MRSMPSVVGVPLDQLQARPYAASWRELAAEDHVVGGGRASAPGHIVEGVEAVAQHPHHRRDAAAGGDEQRLRGALHGQHEVAGRLVELDDEAGLCPAYQDSC